VVGIAMCYLPERGGYEQKLLLGGA
jgi:hypothetical protein